MKVALSVDTKHHTPTHFFHAKKINSKGPKIATSATVVRLHAGHSKGENSTVGESVGKELIVLQCPGPDTERETKHSCITNRVSGEFFVDLDFPSLKDAT